MENDPNDTKLDALFTAARKAGSRGLDTEHGFEARLMARIRAERKERSPFFVWTWRLIPAFVSLIVLIGIWAFISESRSPIDLSAIARIGNEESTLVAFLAGE